VNVVELKLDGYFSRRFGIADCLVFGDLNNKPRKPVMRRQVLPHQHDKIRAF
jgi:hypothetical protein